jgi:hypothetical protein
MRKAATCPSARALVLTMLFVGLTACDRGPTAATVDLGAAALFQSDSARYTMQRVGEISTARLVFTFSNRSGRAAAFVNCGGATSYAVERWTGRRWETVHRPAMFACLSARIVVPIGGTRAMPITILAMPARLLTYPGAGLNAEDVDGVYRIVWNDARRYEGTDDAGGTPLPLTSRVSNSFTLVSPR